MLSTLAKKGSCPSNCNRTRHSNWLRGEWSQYRLKLRSRIMKEPSVLFNERIRQPIESWSNHFKANYTPSVSFSNIIRLFRSFSKWSWLQARGRSSVYRWYRWLRVWTPWQLTKYACVIDSEFPYYFFPIKLNIYSDRSLSTDWCPCQDVALWANIRHASLCWFRTILLY